MKKYLVGLSVGGLMECPDITIKNIQVIEANSEKSAENTYNEVNNCSYFYGKCLGEYNEEAVKLLNSTGKVVDENVIPQYYYLPSSSRNANSHAYQLRDALNSLKKLNASKDNIKKELSHLADWLLERSNDEYDNIVENINNINEFIKELDK